MKILPPGTPCCFGGASAASPLAPALFGAVPGSGLAVAFGVAVTGLPVYASFPLSIAALPCGGVFNGGGGAFPTPAALLGAGTPPDLLAVVFGCGQFGAAEAIGVPTIAPACVADILPSICPVFAAVDTFGPSPGGGMLIIGSLPFGNMGGIPGGLM